MGMKLEIAKPELDHMYIVECDEYAHIRKSTKC